MPRLVVKSFVALLTLSAMPSLAAAGDLQFKKHIINRNTDYSAAALIDVNRDGRLDVVCGGDWYESPNWKKHFVAKVPRIGGRPDGFSHLEFDVNRDGWMDVITVNYRSRSIKWMEHPGETNRAWTIHTVVEPGPMETGRLVDVDGDGQLDLLPNGKNFAAWWEFRWKDRKVKSEPAWIRHELPSDAKGHGAGFGDIDGDGKSDIVGQNGWLQAPADARSGKWQWHPEFKIERGSVPMLVVDVDEDGDNDIVWCSAHGFGVYWLEQAKNADEKREWRRHAIDTSWSQGHAPLWADLDGDGRGELIAGKRYMSHGGSDPGAYEPMRVYRYQFNLATKTWDRWTISDGERVSMGLDPKIADIDLDGDLDLIASGRSGLYWLENLGTGKTAAQTTNIVRVDQDLLLGTNATVRIKEIANPEVWGRRRAGIVSAIVGTHGELPGANARVSLDVLIESQNSGDSYATKKIRYTVDQGRHVSAELYIPNKSKQGATAGIVCMFEQQQSAKANRTAQELATRGYVCLVPTLVTTTDRDAVIDHIWQSMRAADVLQATAEVHGERIGFIGNALHGKLGLYVAALDQRFIVTLTDASRLQGGFIAPGSKYSLAQLFAAAAPRALSISLPNSADTAASCIKAATSAEIVFTLRKNAKNLRVTPSTATPLDREQAYAWLKSRLKP